MNYELLREQLRRHEGYSKLPYQDIVGKVSIGIGRNLDDKGLSDAAIELCFKEDIDEAVADCQKMFAGWHSFPDMIQVVLCNMMFNMGYTRLSGFRQMRDAAMKHEWRRMADEMKDSKWYRQVGKRGEELEQLVRNCDVG